MLVNKFVLFGYNPFYYFFYENFLNDVHLEVKQIKFFTKFSEYDF